MRRFNAAFDRFLFASCSTQTCVLVRIGFGLILLVYTLGWWLDSTLWFSSQGALPVETARAGIPDTCWSLFFWLEPTPELVRICLLVLFANSLLIAAGFFSRAQAAMIFFWLISFQNRCQLIGDGEDNVLRLFAFFMIWVPGDAHLSLSQRWFARRASKSNTAWGEMQEVSSSAWALRLFQVQMICIYLSAAWCKSYGETWLDGSAVYYVYQTADYFGRGPLPGFLLETEWIIRMTTWSVLALEASLPFFLLLRPTRRYAILCGLALHLGMEYAMHLFLFQWVMMLGLLSFTQPADYRWLQRLSGFLPGLAGGTTATTGAKLR